MEKVEELFLKNFYQCFILALFGYFYVPLFLLVVCNMRFYQFIDYVLLVVGSVISVIVIIIHYLFSISMPRLRFSSRCFKKHPKTIGKKVGKLDFMKIWLLTIVIKSIDKSIEVTSKFQEFMKFGIEFFVLNKCSYILL